MKVLVADDLDLPLATCDGQRVVPGWVSSLELPAAGRLTVGRQIRQHSLWRRLP